MRKCIIFGCSNIGQAAYGKLKDYYEIIAWSDNDQELHGREINGIPVVNPSAIPVFSQKYELGYLCIHGSDGRDCKSTQAIRRIKYICLEGRIFLFG